MRDDNTQTMDLWAVPDSDSPDGFRLRLAAKEHRFYYSGGGERARIMEVEVAIPRVNLTRDELIRRAIKTLREKQENIRANAEKEITEIDKRVQELLQLTHDPREHLHVVNTDNDDPPL